jgi:hypothetical protein
LEEIKPLKEIEYEPLILRDHRDPEANIPSNIDITDPLALLDLFIPSAIYTTKVGVKSNGTALVKPPLP